MYKEWEKPTTTKKTKQNWQWAKNRENRKTVLQCKVQKKKIKPKPKQNADKMLVKFNKRETQKQNEILQMLWPKRASLCVCAKSSPKRNNNNNHNNQLGQPAAFDFICLQSALWACIISPTRHCKSRFNAKRRERERQRESGRERALGKLESSLALALSPRSLLATLSLCNFFFASIKWNWNFD